MTEVQTPQPSQQPQQPIQVPYWRLVRVMSGYIFAPLIVFGGTGLFLTKYFDNKAYVFILITIGFFVTMGYLLFNVRKIANKILNQ